MAKVKNPLLSADARGALGNTIIYQKHKGQDTARAYFRPGQPRTPDQITQRDAVTAATHAWRYFLAPTSAHAAWARATRVTHERIAGYHLAMRSLIPSIRDISDPEFCVSVVSFVDTSLRFCFVGAVTGIQNSETGDFDIYAGPSPTSMVLVSTSPLDFGCIVTPPIASIGDVVYSQAFKDGVARSGIHVTEIVSSQWTWTELTNSPARTWISLCMSDDGQYVYAGNDNTDSWRSLDHGQTWSQMISHPGKQALDIGCSSDGQIVGWVATNDRPQYSLDFGALFTIVGGLPVSNYQQAAVAPDGSRALWARNGLRVYESVPITANAVLTDNTDSQQWRGAMIATDNQTQMAVSQTGHFWYTLDAGANWQQTAVDVAADIAAGGLTRDGVYFYATSKLSGLYYSTNLGAAWTIRDSPTANNAGTSAYAGVPPVYLEPHINESLVTTNDRGETWDTYRPWAPDYARVAAIANSGAIAYVGIQNGKIWRGTQ